MGLGLANKTVLITGAAGFIGAGLAQEILKLNENTRVIGIDNMNAYYDISLKRTRLRSLCGSANFIFIEGSIADKTQVDTLFAKYNPDIVINLAAQAGVRYSITNPEVYIESNIVGFYNILEACRHSHDNDASGVEHLLYASSSSVYGNNKKLPYSCSDIVDHPVSLYAATKKSNELMAHAYSKLYGIPSTGLRFFTVYGPMGRPDMAYYSFTEKMINAEPIQLYNYGDMYRDFTYIGDVLACIIRIICKTPVPNKDGVPYKIYNIANNRPENLNDFVEMLEKHLLSEGLISEPAKREYLPMQPGDVYQTYAEVDDLIRDFGFKPNTSLDHGLNEFVKWYKCYHHHNA